ncbi:MAG: agmatinase [Gaiellaceae bacterium]|nr:agmatinase [Gaiellaceae bacterium]
MGHSHHHGPAGEGHWAAEAEGRLPQRGWEAEQAWALEVGLQGADSLEDRTLPLFSRGELPHFAGINTFLKQHFLEDVREVGKYDVAIVGAPLDAGTTYRSGTRFGPQAIRRISALYSPYNFEMGVDLRESLTMCDVGDILTIPANIEKSFDQIANGVGHIFSSGAFPVVLGGDHSIGYPNIRGIAPFVEGNIGIIHVDRHVDTQERDLDERMHTTPWFHATNIPNAPPKNLVQVGIGGWQVPRAGVQIARERGTTILSVNDVMELGVKEAAARALEVAWDGADAVWLSFDIDSVDCGFVPGTGWPEPGGFMPREVLEFLRIVASSGICGMEVVEVSPPYDVADTTALLAVRAIMDVLGSLVAAGKLPKGGAG